MVGSEQATFGPCRFCGQELRRTFLDLGMSPLCESYIPPERLDAMEPFYPLNVLVCDNCLLVQLREYVRAQEIYSEYAYFSSYSDSWLDHARRYVEMAIDRFGLGPDKLVVEVASNDGYLLQYFLERGIPVLGIEPAANVARVAEQKGIRTLVTFFGREVSAELSAGGTRAHLLLGNNVLAHVPDLNGFVAGLKALLAPGGTITMEFAHLMRLVEGNQFDTIYHEHFSYLSLLVTERVFAAHGLTIFDVEELGTHGGSLRIYARHAEESERGVCASVEELRRRETEAGYHRIETYLGFAERVAETKRKLLEFLIGARRQGKRIAGYGAPGKGNTLLNYCGLRTDFLDYTVDRNPYKQGKYLPGTHIPIFAPERLTQTRPEYILILPWNLKDEIMAQLAYARAWGARFVVPIPEVEVYP
jgi:2-polyprenyl-3-methyl-5-hydroxy-6-metoxy-1,4-benzoquinol methylase